MANDVTKIGGNVTRPDERQTDRPGPVFPPATDIYEMEDAVTLAIDLPGVPPENVDVSVENGALTVRGSIDAPAPEGYRRIYAEYAPGTFERAFSLPDGVDPDGIEAIHKDGVLTLTLKKSEAAKPKQIKVKAA